MDMTCGEGQFYNEIVDVCEDCIQDCKVCTSANDCTTCYGNLEFDP
jgi:hypothetical protein